MFTFSEDFREFRENFIKISKKNTNFHALFMKFWMNTLFKLVKNDKIVTTFLLKFWDLSGAKVWESCRSRKSWKNEYLVAIVAVDTAENEPLRNWGDFIHFFNRLPSCDAAARFWRLPTALKKVHVLQLCELIKLRVPRVAFFLGWFSVQS